MSSSSPAHSALISSGSAKRPASPSISSSPVSKKVAKVQEEVDAFDEDLAFDEEALIEATMEAEERAGNTQSSQAASSQGKVGGEGAIPKATNGSNVKSETPAAKQTPTSLTHGDARIEEETLDSEWYNRLKVEIVKPYFGKLKSFLREETSAGRTTYPPANLIHSWSRMTPLSTVKVVVVGQDPYHGPGQACGHSFSVPKGVPVPGSLRNIYKELTTEYGASFKAPNHGCLDSWANQGVLLLNACLTVSANKAGSHHNKGWEPFTQAVLRAVANDASHGASSSIKNSTIANMFSKVDPAVKKGAVEEDKHEEKSASIKSSSKGVVFLVWGLPAAKSLAEAGITEKTPNVLILKSAHPSPLSASRGFLGNGHFKKANEWLEAENRYGKNGGIQWGKL
ncbi:hypothetical protein CBS101457_001955 [Exobasidium rhododendri]|nr:hypothetical protein CBS101457_001955 [Exobasidium rhododendri]